jgi:hypothetical protein
VTDSGNVEDIPDVDAQEGRPDHGLAALALVGRLRADLDRIERDLVGSARERGATWREVAAALGLRSRQAAEQRWLRLRALDRGPAAGRSRLHRSRRRSVDADLWPEVAALRAAVGILYGRLARLADRAGPPHPAVTLALQTLSAAPDATPGALHDLARHAVRDLHGVPPPALGRPVVEALAQVSAMVGGRAGAQT